MPMFRSRVQPVFLADRATVMNRALSPTARLVYVLLLASLDNEETGVEEVAALAGLDSAAALHSYIAELEAVGAADVKDHAGKGEIITVNETPVVPEQRTHACVPCEDCSNCSCEHLKGICRNCYEIRRIRAEAQADIARWQRQVDENKTYAIGSSATRLHRWDCQTLNGVEKGLAALEAGIEAARNNEEYAYYHWPRLPMLYTAEELRLKGSKKRNCAICGPDPL
ncbi:hypothetical protein ACFU98_29615 [Streptomyces sp. NPDC057575]|uniref:hypothetical protein n=1 Tax=unclassified Streptomyces TaxID=2593676 RepID=UPI003674D5AC